MKNNIEDLSSEDLEILANALFFYKYEIDKTHDIEKYIKWRKTAGKIYNQIEIYKGEYKTIEGQPND